MNTTNFISNLSFITIMPLFIILLKNAVDSFNMKTVEKAILTDSQKIIFRLSQLTLFSLISGPILFGLLINNGSIDKNDNLIIYLFTSIFSMFFIALFVLVYGFINLFSIEVNFFIKEKDTQNEWKIERRINKVKVLLSREENIYRFFDAKDVMEQEITRKLVPKEKYRILLHDRIVGLGKISYISLLIFIVLLLVLTIYLFGKDIDPAWKFLVAISLLVTYVFTLYVFIVLNNENVLKKFNK